MPRPIGRRRAWRSKRGRGRLIGRTKGGLNSKLHVLADAKGRPIRMVLSAGQSSDYIAARALPSSIPRAGVLLADRGDDADWFHKAQIEKGITPGIPSRIGRKVPIAHDDDLYRLRHRIETMFARLKDWRRIATRYDRCPILFLPACARAATVICWLGVLTLANTQEMIGNDDENARRQQYSKTERTERSLA